MYVYIHPGLGPGRGSLVEAWPGDMLLRQL